MGDERFGNLTDPAIRHQEEETCLRPQPQRHLPGALIGLLHGRNRGTRMVRIGQEQVSQEAARAG